MGENGGVGVCIWIGLVGVWVGFILFWRNMIVYWCLDLVLGLGMGRVWDLGYGIMYYRLIVFFFV